jgi:hypothetical protein
MRTTGIVSAALLATSILALEGAAQQPAASPSPSEERRTPAAESPMAKLTSARTVLVTRGRGSNIPYDTIKSTLEGWMRFSVVDTPDKADIIVNVETYGDNEAKVSTSMGPNATTGQMEQSSKTTKDLSVSDIKLTVLDAKTKRVLWTSSEKVKFAMKKTTKESNMVEAAERLASRLHDRLEPPQPQEPR